MLVKKHMIALFVNKGTKSAPEWVRIRKGTSFDLSLNPEVQERSYIADARASKEVDSYAPSINQTITMYTGEPDFDLLFPLARALPTGQDARKDVLLVYSFDEIKQKVQVPQYTKADAYLSGTTYYTKSGSVYTEEAVANEDAFNAFSGDLFTKSMVEADATMGYRAWQTEATLSFTNINGNEGTLTMDLNFGGTINKGYVTVDQTTHKPSFTATNGEEGEWVDPFA